MLDFEVQRFTRRCSQTDREFVPGETVYSVLLAEQGEVRREDCCAESWQGPPETAIGWWQWQFPDADANKMHWAPNDVILHYFEQLEGNRQKADMRYVLALLMIRRRIVRWEETVEDDGPHEVLVLYCPRNEREYRVDLVVPNDSRVVEIQNELAELLFANKS